MKTKKLILPFLLLANCLLLTANSFSQNWIWAKSGSGTGYNEGYSVATDVSGNLYATGYFVSPSITFGTYTLTSTGGENVFLVKYDLGGNVLWAQNATCTGLVEGNSVTTDDSGNVYLTGQFTSSSVTFGSQTINNSSSSWDFFLVKYNSAGIAVWARSALVTNTNQVEGESITTDNAGNIYVTGYFATATSVTFGSITLTCAGSTDIFIVKYDAMGNVLWAKSAGGTNTDMGKGISADGLGNVYVTGSFASSSISLGTYTLTNLSSVGYNIFLVKYDSVGNVLWAKSAGGTNQDAAYSVATDKTGNVYMTGGFWSSLITFGTYTFTHTTNDPDIFIVKYDGMGNALWAKTAGSISYDYGYSVATDANNNVYMSGGFATTSSYSITFGSYIIPYPIGGHDPMFIVKFDSVGNVLCASALASGGDDQNGIATDPFGNAYIGSDFEVSPFALGTNTLTLTGLENIFVAKYEPACINPEGVNDLSNKEVVSIYPNPTSGIFNLQMSQFGNVQIKIYNVYGECIHQQIYKSTNQQIDLSKQANGIYFVHLISEKENAMKKIIIQK